MENAVEGKSLRGNPDRAKVCSYYFGRKVMFWKWIFVVSVRGLIVILFIIRNVRGGFISVVLMCLGR